MADHMQRQLTSVWETLRAIAWVTGLMVLVLACLSALLAVASLLLDALQQ